MLPRVPPVNFVRIMLLALLGALGAGWALANHFHVGFAPMEVAVPRAAPTYDADAGEIPVPEIDRGP